MELLINATNQWQGDANAAGDAIYGGKKRAERLRRAAIRAA